MMSPAQYAAAGPLARAIIDHDRAAADEANAIAASPVVEIGWGAHIRARNASRAELTAAAAKICNRGSNPNPTGPRTATARAA